MGGKCSKLIQPYDLYIVQWQHRSHHHDFLALDQGEIVIAREYHRRLLFYCKLWAWKECIKWREISYEVEGTTKEIQNLAMVQRLRRKKGCSNRGLISITYLQSLSSTGLPKTAVGRAILSAYDIPREILECRWFVGCANPVEVGIWLRNDLQSSSGSYLVCQPSEIIPYTARWPDFIIVVKCLTGNWLRSEEEFYREWEEDRKHNLKYKLSKAYPMRVIKSDPMPDTKQPLPPIAYIRIRRTVYAFQIEQKLALDLPAPLALRYPAEYHSNPVLGPKPIEIPAPLMTYRMPRHINGLVMVPDRKRHIPAAILASEGHYSEVAFKQLKRCYFQEKLFEECLNLLYIERRRQHDTALLKEAKSVLYYGQGEEYICKIAGFSTNDKVYGPWVAYEFICGNPLDVALVMRKRDGLPPLSHRSNFEIMYQAAGMRYLEDNNLYHQDLRAANILVYVQHQYSMAIKITDYMLTLSILSKLPENSDLSSLHWRWMSPEALEGCQFGIKTDVWSFGCVMFEILNPGRLPYSLEKVPIDDPKKYA
uniref:Protein kinase domain-containing protein n=1 Tax=Setaria digitata TaxID=48799 RepID=A0A915PUC2_9BILA